MHISLGKFLSLSLLLMVCLALAACSPSGQDQETSKKAKPETPQIDVNAAIQGTWVIDFEKTAEASAWSEADKKFVADIVHNALITFDPPQETMTLTMNGLPSAKGMKYLSGHGNSARYELKDDGIIEITVLGEGSLSVKGGNDGDVTVLRRKSNIP